MGIFDNENGFGTFPGNPGMQPFGYNPVRTMNLVNPMFGQNMQPTSPAPSTPWGAPDGAGLGMVSSDQPGQASGFGHSPSVGYVPEGEGQGMTPLQELMAFKTGHVGEASNVAGVQFYNKHDGQHPLDDNLERQGQELQGGGQESATATGSTPYHDDPFFNDDLDAYGDIADGKEKTDPSLPKVNDPSSDPDDPDNPEKDPDYVRDRVREGTMFGYLEASGGILTLFDKDGKVRGTYPYTSGVPGVSDETIRNQGPIPKGVYYLDPNKIVKYDPEKLNLWDLRREPSWPLGSWGHYRVKLHPATETITHGRDGFYLHGGDTPGSLGCIDVGNQDVVLFPLLSQSPGKIRLTVK